jgi:hypothetical protein
MEESAEEALKREETLRIYNATKEALKIISDVARDTISEQIPPPIRGVESYSTLPAPTQSSYTSRPASPKPVRQAPTAPSSRPAPPAPAPTAYQSQPMAQSTPPQPQQNGFSFTITPSNIGNALNMAQSVMSNIGKFAPAKAEPPSRPAPLPGNQSASTTSLPNPLIPQ